MKCVIVAVMIACATLASTGVVPGYPWGGVVPGYPWAGYPWGYPWAAPAGPITQYSSVPAYPYPGISYAHHVSAVAKVVAPAAVPVVAHPAVVVAKPAASFTAATRGAVFQAPLEGHAVSQTALNLAPAPGTV